LLGRADPGFGLDGAVWGALGRDNAIDVIGSGRIGLESDTEEPERLISIIGMLLRLIECDCVELKRQDRH
jgi:hypothetical protein